MWAFTTSGFFSVVQKPGEAGLTIRARRREDLDRLRDNYLPQLSPTVETPMADYHFRANVGHADFAAAVAKMVTDIDYANFKDEVARVDGAEERSCIYHDVWEAALALQDPQREEDDDDRTEEEVP